MAASAVVCGAACGAACGVVCGVVCGVTSGVVCGVTSGVASGVASSVGSIAVVCVTLVFSLSLSGHYVCADSSLGSPRWLLLRWQICCPHHSGGEC